MAWTAPRTWVSGEIEIATTFNLELKDNQNALFTPPAAFVFGSLATLANSTLTALTFTLESWDTDGMVDLAGAPTRVTIQTAGRYLVIAHAQFPEELDAGIRQAFVDVNDSTSITDKPASGQLPVTTAGNPTMLMLHNRVMRFAAADFLVLKLFQDSGAAFVNDCFGSLAAVFVGP